MQMRQSNWLSNSYNINIFVYERLQVVYKMAVGGLRVITGKFNSFYYDFC